MSDDALLLMFFALPVVVGCCAWAWEYGAHGGYIAGIKSFGLIRTSSGDDNDDDEYVEEGKK